MSISFVPQVNINDYNLIQPVSSSPIKQIPNYMFANPNQAVANQYSEDLLSKLKKGAKVIDKNLLQKTIKDKSVLLKKAQEYDWINSLTYLETEYLSNVNSVDEAINLLAPDKIIALNGMLTRLSSEQGGKFRTRAIRWPNWDLDINETIVEKLLGTFLKQSNEWYTKLSDIENTEEYEDGIFEIACEKIEAELRTYKKNPHALQSADTATQEFLKNNASNIKPNIVYKWAREEQGRSDGKINMVRWLRKRCHYFPVNNLKEQLGETLEFLKTNASLHPIEKASKLWYECIRLHISNEGNKRTAKLAASTILLAAGYLPPEIEGEDGKRYVKTLQECFTEKDGHIAFTQFIAELIVKTQNKYGVTL